MAIRTREELRRDQQQLLSEYRRLRSAAPAGSSIGQLPTPGSPLAVLLFGRVSQIVNSDPTYGAHLIVVPQDVSGTPPTFSDSPAAAIRCYPPPNHAVGEYSLNEKVNVLTLRGAFIADKLA